MDKNAIKKYAVWAREELIKRVSVRAAQFGITNDNVVDADTNTVNGKLLSVDEKKQREKLIVQIKSKGYEQVMEEVAYTWFNRFCALRFMEVNNYLPTHIRVFTDEENNFKPQIITEAIHMELEGIDKAKVLELKEKDANDELYKYLIIIQCNALSSILPQMFPKISDYTELLFPDNILREGSTLQQMIELIQEEDWKDAVQIIGWLYQYYNSKPKDKVFTDLKKNIKISKEKIPAATQLFTPDWIVRYMVENSLGRLWLEGHPNDELKSEWKYYLEEAEQESDVKVHLAETRREYSVLKPENIMCIDPCMGSGHTIVYMFDVLMKIYVTYGYSTRESVLSIIENNLYGLDIDERAAQLAYFAVMMKAVQYDNRFLKRSNIPQPHLYFIKESNHLDSYCVEYFCNSDKKLTTDMNILIGEMHDASEYGSILNVTNVDFAVLFARFEEIKGEISIYKEIVLNELLPFVQVAQALAQKYEIVVTNPPYMGNKSMSDCLTNYLKKYYQDSKTDMYSVFIERCLNMTVSNGFIAMITQHSWMFLSSFEKLRKNILSNDIINMSHLGSRAFEEIGGEVVQTTTWIMKKKALDNYVGTYIRLVDADSQDKKEYNYLAGKGKYKAKKESFMLIPGATIAYWISDHINQTFNNPKLEDYALPLVGMFTTDNNKYLRLWWEPSLYKIGFGFTNKNEAFSSNKSYFPYNKGASCIM